MSVTPAKARLICDLADVINSKVSDEIRDLAKTHTVRDLELGPYSEMLGTASESALQHCLDNPVSCVLISPKSYDALSVALCDAYLSKREGPVLIMCDDLKDSGHIVSTILTYHKDTKIYNSKAKSNPSLESCQFVVVDIVDFMSNDIGKINFKSAIAFKRTTYLNSGSALPLAFKFLYEFDRLILIEETSGLGDYGDFEVNRLTMTSSTIYADGVRYMKGTDVGFFDKMNFRAITTGNPPKYPVVDMARLMGIFYPRIKDVYFLDSTRSLPSDVSKSAYDNVSKIYDSIPKESTAQMFIEGGIDERKRIIEIHDSRSSWNLLKSAVVIDIIKLARQMDYRPIVRTSNVEAAVRMKTSIILPELTYEDEDNDNMAKARFLYPSPLHQKYKKENKKIFTSNGIIVVDNIVDDIDLLNHCTMMIYCEPFIDRESYELEYQLCKTFNIRMVMACVPQSYEQYLVKKGWYK